MIYPSGPIILRQDLVQALLRIYKEPFVKWMDQRAKVLCDWDLVQEVGSYRFVLTTVGNTFAFKVPELRRQTERWFQGPDYDAGCEARRNMVSIHHCPHAHDGPARHSWIWGWLEVDRLNAREYPYTIYELGSS